MLISNGSIVKVPRVWLNTSVVVLFLILFAIQKPYSILSCYVITAGYLVLQNDIISFNRKPFLVFVVAVGLCLPALFLLNHGPTPFVYLILSPILLLFANVYAKQDIFSITLSLKHSLRFLVTIVLIGIFFNRDEISPLEGLIPGTSSNGITSFLIILYIPFAICSLRTVGRLPVREAVAVFFISLIGLGRGSILVSLALLIFAISFNVYISKLKFFYKVVLLLLTIIPITTYCVINFNDIAQLISDVIASSKFAHSVADGPRAQILTEYMAKIDAVSFILGSNYSGTSIINVFDNNPHNSYIRIHSFYGIWGVFLVFLPVLFILFSKVRWLLKFAVLFLISSMLARAFSEPLFFPTPLDVFYFLSIFVYYYHCIPHHSMRS